MSTPALVREAEGALSETAPAPTVESIVEQITLALDAARSQRRKVRRALDKLDGEVGRLEQARDLFSEKPARRRAAASVAAPAANGDLTGNTAVVEGLMREARVATQASLAKALGKPKNSAKHALGVLERRGLVRPTGERENRSPVYEWIGDA